MADSVRIDKYLWAIRVFKTRTEAMEACKGNKVQVNGTVVKPSRNVQVGDTLTIRKTIQYSFRILQLTENRMGAQLVPQYAENLTPESELEKLHAPRETFFVQRDRGTGRPTKKERRTLDYLWDQFDQED